jgi:hypothetical protein
MYKKQFPLLLAFLGGAIPIISFFITTPGDRLKVTTDTLQDWMLIIAGAALLLGVVNLFQINLRKISTRAKGWPNALWLLLSLVIAATFGLADAFGTSVFGIWGGDVAFQWIQDAAFKPLQATMFSLLAFYVASAAFRAFRVRNVEAGILLAAALIIMLGVNPYAVKFLPFLPDATNWIMNIPNAAAQRGIIIGAALGAASFSLRILLGIERSYLGLQKGE